ncbi:MAG: transcription elongation factor GreA, partial [Oscillospiraceae bacterium]
MSKEILLTQAGYDDLVQELEFLKTEKRAELAEKIKIARGFGDLSENSEYDEAKNEQAMVESRIGEIENLFKNVTVLDEDGI